MFRGIGYQESETVQYYQQPIGSTETLVSDKQLADSVVNDMNEFMIKKHSRTLYEKNKQGINTLQVYKLALKHIHTPQNLNLVAPEDYEEVCRNYPFFDPKNRPFAIFLVSNNHNIHHGKKTDSIMTTITRIMVFTKEKRLLLASKTLSQYIEQENGQLSYLTVSSNAYNALKRHIEDLDPEIKKQRLELEKKEKEMLLQIKTIQNEKELIIRARANFAATEIVALIKKYDPNFAVVMNNSSASAKYSLATFQKIRQLINEDKDLAIKTPHPILSIKDGKESCSISLQDIANRKTPLICISESGVRAIDHMIKLLTSIKS